MAKASETGHAKNISNFDVLITTCEGYGVAYNPTKAAIKVVNLKVQYTAALASNTLYATKSRTNNDDKNDRKAGFQPVKKLATRLLNALKATDASDDTVADAEGFQRKIQGERAESKPKPTIPPSPDNSHSVAQQSYTNMVEHLKGLNLVLSTESTYAPNENELTTATIAILVTNLTTLNKNESVSFIAMDNSKIDRNAKLYGVKTGILDTEQEVKDYVKSVYGSTSPQYKQLTKLKFKDSR